MLDTAGHIIFLAYVLDYFSGDPRWLPHPVVCMGNAIAFFEPLFRRLQKNPLASGGMFALFLMAGAWMIGYGFVKISILLHPLLGAVIQILLLFYCFSSASLEKAGMAVLNALHKNDLPQARKKAGIIVGRQTQNLDEKGVTRACIESIAENFVDGFLSPLFFAVIGGVPLALAYKMVNTLDSMVGYKNEKYLYFGRISARMDDAANFIPARISVCIIAAATSILISFEKGKNALKTGFSQGRLHQSPNAGFPEGAFAGALRIRLGGPVVYDGKRIENPFIGKEFKDPDIGNIKSACRIMRLASFLAILVSCLILFLV